MFYVENGSDQRLYQAQEGRKVVLLLGDSMRLGSCATTKRELEDIADVVYPEENCRNSQYIITRIRAWAQELDGEHISLVHFNCGHWDAAHFNRDEEALTPLDQYERNIHCIVRNIRRLFPNAKICFGTTTPINPDERLLEQANNPRTRASIIQYNEAAVRAAKAENIPIDDIFSFTEDWPSSMYIDACHFTPEAFEKMGCFVAKFIRSQLLE